MRARRKDKYGFPIKNSTVGWVEERNPIIGHLYLFLE
jgi:hypothetical protein